LELPQLLLKSLALHLKIGVTPPVFLKGQDVFQIGLGKTFQLVSQLESSLVEILLACLEFLRQPSAGLGAEEP
jgi:hypothetical protein